MDELRMHHDEVTVVANRTGPGYNKGNDGNLHSLPVLGRFLLCFSGHMQFGNGLASRFLLSSAMLSFHSLSPSCYCAQLISIPSGASPRA